ncbi:hypothetical protein Goari_004601 [Gossypium aridum]|uniref:RNase H type-1 domain-containing protein n=1 Tax=Gossypium aridum TaxID=34290 RepID=A0A7J8Y3Y1_GOSAI|nr:hypothetical protein [Gossypium aridum]
MSIFLAPRRTMEEMTSKICRWWWGGKCGGSSRRETLCAFKFLARNISRMVTYSIARRLINHPSVGQVYWRLRELMKKDLVCMWQMVLGFDSVKIGGVSRVLMNVEHVRMLYGKFMASWISDIPILPHGSSNRVVWFHNVHGIYTTKSTYSWLLLKNVGHGPHRNNATFKGKEKDPRVIWEIAYKLNDDFQIHNLSLRPILPWVPRDCKWETPLEGVSKVNIDVSMKDNKTGLSIILRGSNDFVLCGKAIFIDKATNPKLAELVALLVGIRLA